MNIHWWYRFSLVSMTLLLPTLAMAHTGHGLTSGFFAGLNHPFSGADHVLAMVAVGILAAQLGGHALWAVPSAFITAMILGGILGMYGLSIPFVEAEILGSLLVLGTLIASSIRLSTLTSILIVSFCAIFHGYAHGAEMPIGSGALTYGIGFMISTATLHGLGIIFGISLQRLGFVDLPRLAGGVVILGGLYLAIT